ncbi:hypothetical protein RAZWK3B_03775 [Roseobacter sp. AzwK-3b]|nr:hypothetical protein RAZWK3B_03775 [Roseobacter sp. AzwK-3b]
MTIDATARFKTPEAVTPEAFTDPRAAVTRLVALYDAAVGFLSCEFRAAL